MPRKGTKLNRKKKRMLLILRDTELRYQLASGLTKSGAIVFQAETRADGMPLLFRIRPDLIYLGAMVERGESWETFHRIRILTDTPIVILADQPAPAGERPRSKGNVLVLVQPFSIAEAIAKGKALERQAAARKHQSPSRKKGRNRWGGAGGEASIGGERYLYTREPPQRVE